MKNLYFFLLLFFCLCNAIVAQDTTDDIEFNDRSTNTHGVFIGLDAGYGIINKESTYVVGAKLAYVTNDKLELGFAGKAFFSEQEFDPTLNPDGDVYGVYGGIYVSPIVFRSANISISIPTIIGAGNVGYTNSKLRDANYENLETKDNDYVVLVEPGVALGYEVSKYIQLEALASYRLSSKVQLEGSTMENINGFTAGLGIKIGVFNF